MNTIPSARLVDHMADFYDRFGPQYDAWASGINAKVGSRLVEFAEPAPGERALDIGTGTGLVAHGLAARVGPEGLVVGIDLCESMLELARGKGVPPNVRFMGMAAEELVFRDCTFDLVTYGQSLSYLIDPRASLQEAVRVLKPGGRIALTMQSRELSTQAQDLFFRSLGPLADRHGIHLPRHPDSHARLAERPALTSLLEILGFREVRMTQLVTGGRSQTSREWTDLMAGFGPLPFTLISVLGPRPRTAFEAELVDCMKPLGEDAFRYHFSFLFSAARKY